MGVQMKVLQSNKSFTVILTVNQCNIGLYLSFSISTLVRYSPIVN